MILQDYNQLIDELDERINNRTLFCIEGYCGSGKTYLSDLLSKQYDMNVIHMDHFYLPFKRREENWKEIIAGNMDLKRLLNDVIKPYRNNEDATYYEYDPHTDTILRTLTISCNKPLCIEGSYSSHPMLKDYYDIRIILICSEEAQINRLKRREGINIENFRNIWIRKEMEYFETCKPDADADYLIDNSRLY